MATLELLSPYTLNETARQSKTRAVRVSRFAMDCRCAAVNSCPDSTVSCWRSARSSQT
jgi:hypothetical protein